MSISDSTKNEQAFAELSLALEPAELSADERNRMHNKILDRIRDDAPDGTYTIRGASGEWVEALPLVEMKVLQQDSEKNRQTVLCRLHPGAVFPAHSHAQFEECLVLEGELKIGNHMIGPGDLHVAQPGSQHPPIESMAGALLLLHQEIRDALSV